MTKTDEECMIRENHRAIHLIIKQAGTKKQVEKQKDGCNPVPILDENKKDDGTTITISKGFFAAEQNPF